MPLGVPIERIEQRYDSEVERLCAYLKNDSLIRWSLGCSQAEIDTARAKLAKRRRYMTGMPHLPPSQAKGSPTAEMEQRVARAAISNRRYLRAVAKAGG